MPKKIKRIWADNKGVAAVEFAMIALPFFTLLVGIVEISLFYTANIMLEGGTIEAARLVRTGEAVNSGDPEGTFQARLCDQVDAFLDCNNIRYESLALGTASGGFTAAAGSDAQYDGNGDPVTGGFTAGSSEEIMLVRAFYNYEFKTPFIGTLITGNAADTSVMLVSTAVIRNEPYSFGG